ncbi:MAG: glutaredoxin 3 [Gammaproteobacteria bacterium]
MNIVIYTTKTCPYCYRAKSLLTKLGVSFEEISVDFNSSLRAEMAAKAGKTSVPQIWINGSHIGGCDDLYALHDKGDLQKLLT